MKQRMYVRCPHCRAEEPLTVETDAERVEDGSEMIQHCSVCGAAVLLSKTTILLRP